ncbi:MAG: hypothetical protein ABIQ07_06625 [Ginsengibacter sp.]
MKNEMLLAYVFLLIFTSCSHPTYKEPHVLIETNFGNIEVELYPVKAPKSVAAFYLILIPVSIKTVLFTGY